MSATKPASKTELKDYALRRLGYPTIDINVATEQLDDLIEEAIDYYQEYHYNGDRMNISNSIEDCSRMPAEQKSLYHNPFFLRKMH